MNGGEERSRVFCISCGDSSPSFQFQKSVFDQMSNTILEEAENAEMEVVIPPKKNRNVQRPYDKELYRARHLVENAFLKLKRWRGIATRYAKNAASFLATVHIRCLFLWLDIS